MKRYILISLLLGSYACQNKQDFDASGYFEADEVIVSAQQAGELISYSVEEGKQLKEGEQVGQINTELLQIQKQQVEASISSLKEKTNNPSPQITLINKQLEVQKAQLKQQLHEQKRFENLVKGGAATQKQLDDLNASVEQLQKQITVTEQQLAVSLSNINTQNRSILSEQSPLEKNKALVEEQISRGTITNPVTGTVLVNYALKGELQTIGKPLYKIANIDTLTLRAYITGDQLPQLKVGQAVTVRTDATEKEGKTYQGQIVWIADKAEFTPKTIQTKKERSNLVYAAKIKVKNDGYLKIGMYGEVIFSAENK